MQLKQYPDQPDQLVNPFVLQCTSSVRSYSKRYLVSSLVAGALCYFFPYYSNAVDTYSSHYVLLTSLFYSHFVIFGIVEQLSCCTYSAAVLQCLDILSNRTKCPDFLFVQPSFIFGLQLKGQFITDQLIARRSFADTVANRTERPGFSTCPAVIYRALPNRKKCSTQPS